MNDLLRRPIARWLSLLLVSASIQAADLDNLHHIGGGEMRYLFWTLYRADFFAASHPYRANAEFDKALKIEYFRAIDREDLLSVTVDQWEHQGIDPTKINAWENQLKHIWPDVDPGDTLTLVVKSNGKSKFYFDDRYIGAVDDKSFGTAFLDIWLSEQTSEPELRQQLLGLTP